MPKLPYSPEQFGRYMGDAFTVPGEISFSWEELCRAAVTVGRRSWADVLQFGTYSIFEIMWRLAMLRANLVEEPDGRLRKSRAFESLDPSEKSAISYFLGLVVTKLVAEKLFGVAWLLHLDVYSQYLNPTLALPNKPDFVGLDTTNRWVVIESKGRTNGATTGLMQSGSSKHVHCATSAEHCQSCAQPWQATFQVNVYVHVFAILKSMTTTPPTCQLSPTS